MARPVDVGVGISVILTKNDSVLLMKRQGSHGSGTWAFPGGWIDRSDKHPSDVSKREAMEEVGVTVHESVLIGVSSEDHENFRTVTLHFLATDWEGEPQICEPQKCTDLVWHPIHVNLPQPTFPGLAEGIRLLSVYRDLTCP